MKEWGSYLRYPLINNPCRGCRVSFVKRYKDVRGTMNILNDLGVRISHHHYYT